MYFSSQTYDNQCKDQYRAERKRVGIGAIVPPPDFGRYANPFSTKGVNYAHQITTSPSPLPDRIFKPSYGPEVYALCLIKMIMPAHSSTIRAKTMWTTGMLSLGVLGVP